MRINSYMPHIIHSCKKRADKIRKFIGDYIYYRKRNHKHSMAWNLARDTL